MKIALAPNDTDDTLDRLVMAMERIADSVAKLAGCHAHVLNRGMSRMRRTIKTLQAVHERVSLLSQGQ